jgi:hypothetical protein
MDANALINRPPDVTRSTVQKAVVVVTDGPQHFGQFREKLSIVTLAWFAQRYVAQSSLSLEWNFLSRFAIRMDVLMVRRPLK